MVAIPRRIQPEPAPRRSWPADSAYGILGAAGAWLLATAVAHGLRYIALAWYADRVAPWWIEAVTSALVWVTGIVAIAMGACAAIAATAWLVQERRRAYEPGTDPRSKLRLWLGGLVVVVNFFRLPVYLEELRRASPRAPTRSALRRWWGVWAVNVLAVAVALWRGSADGPQAAADAVLLTAIAALTAAWALRETRGVMKSFGEPPPGFTRRLIPAGMVDSSASRKE